MDSKITDTELILDKFDNYVLYEANIKGLTRIESYVQQGMYMQNEIIMRFYFGREVREICIPIRSITISGSVLTSIGIPLTVVKLLLLRINSIWNSKITCR